MVGQTFSKIEGEPGSETVQFYGEDGKLKYTMLHYQDCCEQVEVYEIIGDMSDLCGTPILEAREDSNNEETVYESSTWTFYNFRTIKGSVTIRWLGTSNGYYSESVDIVKEGESPHGDSSHD
jgi:hypothetical protein